MQMTLNQTWILCLRMWKWIKKVWQTEGYENISIDQLKLMWLRDNGFDSGHIRAWCFFCDYKGACLPCDIYCPGALVDTEFNCSSDAHNFETNPAGFYKELLRLNRIRKTKEVT